MLKYALNTNRNKTIQITNYLFSIGVQPSTPGNTAKRGLSGMGFPPSQILK